MTRSRQVMLFSLGFIAVSCWSELMLVEDFRYYSSASQMGLEVDATHGLAALTYRMPARSQVRVVTENEVASGAGPTVFGDHRETNGHVVASGGDGVVTALFTLTDGQLRATRYVSGSWTSPQTIATNAARPRVKADVSGNVLAVWVNGTNLQSARHDRRAWSTPVTLTRSATAIASLRLALSGLNYGVAVWCEVRATGTWVVASVLPPTGGFRTPTDLGAVPACAAIPGWDHLRPALTVDVAMSMFGETKVVWTDGSLKYVEASPVFGGGWTVPVTLAAETDVQNVRIAANTFGDAIVAFMHPYANNRIKVRMFDAQADHWHPVVSVRDTRLGNPDMSVGIDDEGDGTIAFMPEGNNSVAVAQVSGDRLLSTEVVGETAMVEFDLSMRPDGSGFIALRRGDTAIYASKYEP